MPELQELTDVIKSEISNLKSDVVSTMEEKMNERLEVVSNSLVSINERLDTPSVPEKLYAQAKSHAENPLHEIRDMFLADERVQRFVENPGSGNSFSVTLDVGDLLVRALTDFATIDTARVVAPMYSPTPVLDYVYRMPWGAGTYRQRLQAAVSNIGEHDPAANSGAGEMLNEGQANITPTDFAMRTFGVWLAIANSELATDDGDTVMGSSMVNVVRGMDKRLHSDIISSPGTGVRWASLVSQLTGTSTSAVAANTNILATVEAKITEIRQRGGLANYVLCNAANAAMIRKVLTDQRSPFAGDQAAPYGRPLGAPVIVTPDLPANTLIIASFDGTDEYSVMPVLRDMTLKTDTSVRSLFSQTVLIAEFQGNFVVNQPLAFHRYTTSNNFRVDA